MTMMKTKIALAVLLTTFVLAPASAAKSKKSGKATPAQALKTRPAKAVVAAPVAARVNPQPVERKSDRWFDSLSMQFLNAQWRIDPETAIVNGKYDGAANLTVPSAATRAQQLAFANEWLQKLGKLDPRQLSSRQRTDLALLLNKLNADRWYLTTFREFEWNPALYNIAQPIDLVLGTEYAS